MKKILKIAISISLLLLCIGVVCAETHPVDIFKAPNGLHSMGYSSFVDEKGHNIMINEYNADNMKTWFENDTDPEYLVQPYETNNSFYLGVDDDNDCYILEIVEKEGNKYIIGSWTPKGPNEAKEIMDNLLEFNKLNKVKPLPIES